MTDCQAAIVFVWSFSASGCVTFRGNSYWQEVFKRHGVDLRFDSGDSDFVIDLGPEGKVKRWVLGWLVGWVGG